MVARERRSIHEESAAWRSALEAEEAKLESALRGCKPATPLLLDLFPAPEFPHEERGVYLAPFLSKRGRRIIYAVDRAGRYVARLVLNDPARWREAERTLAQTLDTLDPSPVQLVP